MPLDGSETFELCVTIPPEARADTYVGTVFLLADGDTQFDELTVTVVVNCIADMDVSADVAALQLYDAGNGTAKNSRVFTLTNEGNCDLSGINGLVTLDDGFTTTVTIESAVDYGDEVEGLVTIEADQSHPAGTYHGTVTLIAEGGATDNFPITVIMPEFAAIEFGAETLAEEGVGGETTTLTDVVIVNTGNVDVDSGITFVLGDLIGHQTDSVIPGSGAVFPEGLSVAYDGDVLFDILIPVPDGLLGQSYEGSLQVLHEGVEMDVLTVTITLERGEGYIAIYPNPYRIGENEDDLIIALGDEYDGGAVMVYDMFGGLVADLTPGAARDTNVPWDLTNDDGKNVASGMYIVTIDTGGEVVTRKIMVIK